MKEVSTNNFPNKEERHKLFGSVEPGKKIKPTEKDKMPDLQNTQKDFLFDINQVGIVNVKHPIQVSGKLKPTTQTTIGTFKMTSSINKNLKGTNMSRFTEMMQEYSKDNTFEISVSKLKIFAQKMAERLEHDNNQITVSFPWFFERSGPASDIKGMNHADAEISVMYDRNLGYRFEVSLQGTITTLCPCSKEISEYSAHNQRGLVTMKAELTGDFDEEQIDWKQALLEAAESNASARIHPVLKRPDEKMVTEQAYENPRFVEDMVRLVAADLFELSFVQKFTVTCQNEESIHLHDAFASISYDKSLHN
ncbi:GTP cyclohydrolase I type 2 [Gracilibacillus boraciitolerans JCM 21714]|uniref:GTP cyclohydrolase FolE2 n=1 Tax=Gracilibacillus boraciitolerans JCM 21714 TaxID=1298598 RepID=W4VFB7_9BACI|nr:GTP cyclohydrolase FolE2 [Gracilibacillus boraciitolerans]GAE91503.1 GTP cyclohydrolase I type 2 [Gracilibacillus boraciitolerans JCM 21714]